MSLEFLLLPQQSELGLLESLAVEGRLLQDLYLGGLLLRLGVRDQLAERLKGVPQVYPPLPLQGIVYRTPPLVVVSLVPPPVFGGLDDLGRRKGQQVV